MNSNPIENKEIKADVMKYLMTNYSTGNKEAFHEMRIKAINLCKQGKLSLHQLQMLFPIEMLTISFGIKRELVEDEEVTNTVTATTVTDEILKREIKIERGNSFDEAIIEEKVFKSVAATTVPDGLVLKRLDPKETEVGIFSLKEVKKDIIFGPFVGVIIYDRKDAYEHGHCWDIYKNNEFHHCVDARNSSESNWMRFVNPTDSSELQNLESFQRGYQVYFRAIKNIPAGGELLVWYSLQYNQDCHQTVPNLEKKSGISLNKIVTFIKKYNTRCKKFEKLMHTGKKLLKWDVCETVFSHSSNIATHKRIHTGKKSFKCDICEKAFTQNSSLNIHKRTHTGEKPFNCDECDKVFNNGYSLTRHKRNHTGEKPFKCDKCEKSYIISSRLKTHELTHSGEKPFKCDNCDKVFSHGSSLIIHKRTHTGERPFKCDICDKVFSSSSNLTAHKRTHTGIKPFKCDKCEKAFTQNSSLTIHKRIHTGEKPFNCDECDKVFNSGYSLTRHKRSHTNVRKSTLLALI